MTRTRIDFRELLKFLAASELDFILVGGICAALHGSPFPTYDLDLVYSREKKNLERLSVALKELHAVYRLKPELSPDFQSLDGPGAHNLLTKFGPLDLMGATIGGGYQDLIEHTEPISLPDGKTIRMLDLITLIKIKETLAGQRDLAVLPILRRLLDEKNKS